MCVRAVCMVCAIGEGACDRKGETGEPRATTLDARGEVDWRVGHVRREGEGGGEGEGKGLRTQKAVVHCVAASTMGGHTTRAMDRRASRASLDRIRSCRKSGAILADAPASHPRGDRIRNRFRCYRVSAVHFFKILSRKLVFNKPIL